MRDHALATVIPLKPQPTLSANRQVPAICLLEAECIVQAIRTVLLARKDRPVCELNTGIELAIAKLVAARALLNDNAPQALEAAQ